MPHDDRLEVPFTGVQVCLTTPPERHKRKRRLYHKDSSIIRMRPNAPNHVWAIDFVHDKLSNNRPYKMLTVVDEYTRQALFALEVPLFSIGGLPKPY